MSKIKSNPNMISIISTVIISIITIYTRASF